MRSIETDPDLVPSFLKPSWGAGCRKLRLVLVESDWRAHAALRKVFTALGWEVDSAMTVAGGLALIGRDPDALILDLDLPDGDGLDVLRRVRFERLKARVVVATGGGDSRQDAAIRELRPDALVRKPVEFEAVIRALGGDRSG